MSAPADQPARDRIRDDLDATLFVDAGAGAGKTTALVDRILSLVATGVPLTGIAAITFSEKAAGELRHRLREQLTAAATEAAGCRYTQALESLDTAPIGTLHAFARRLLFEHPIEAGLPPGFTVLDELESRLAFDERWEDLIDELLDDPTPPGGLIEGGTEFVQLCQFDYLGVATGVRRIAEAFHDNWDLVEARVDRTAPAPLELAAERVVELAAEAGRWETPPDDTQHRYTADAARLGQLLGESTNLGTRLGALAELVAAARCIAGKGSQAKWKRNPGVDALFELRALGAELEHEASAALARVHEHRKHVLGAVLARFVLDAARERAVDGTLEFHDLLVIARRLLATRPDVRAAAHRRYERVLLDEFQDTDPIQLEIAVRLTADPADPAHTTEWRDLRPLPGRLFVVGDPKQSIYRFRRADIAQYLVAAEQVGADTEVLSANFRSSTAVIDWVNAVFGRLIVADGAVQPPYQPLDVCRPRHCTHGSVHVLGAEPHLDLRPRGDAEVLREREALDVVGAITAALTDGWLVEDDATHELRPCRPGDIAVLLPARTSLPALEAALREHHVPYRAENSSVVYVTTEIRHLMLALRAADDSTDQLALVAALRTPLYGCSDVELYEWRVGGGRWNIWAPIPTDLESHPVAAAIAHLRSVAERSSWRSPADLLADLVDERRVLDLALDGVDARDVWRRVRFVIDQARAWADAGGHGLRRYLAWARLQAAEGRAADTVLPEHDRDAIRVMTIHAAKGLEFPITIVTGLTTRPSGRSGTTGVVWPDQTWALTKKGADEVYDDFKPLDEQMSDAERRRLLYVACTRAVDHLVVSLHRLPDTDKSPDKCTSGELLSWGGAADPTTGATPLTPSATVLAGAPPRPVELPWADPEAWAAERERALTAATRRSTISATRLAEDLARLGHGADEGLAKDPVDLELPPWQRGRYGTAVGRAVHGVLQFADLADGHDIEDLARAQCSAEGILGWHDTVTALARSALEAPVVVAAAGGAEHHRELFVAADLGGRVLEGYVDLLVRTPSGLTIVDYKTDQWRDGTNRDERIGRYRRQLAAYGAALERVLGEPVVGGVLVRCRAEQPAEQIEVPAWREAVDEIAAAMALD